MQEKKDEREKVMQEKDTQAKRNACCKRKITEVAAGGVSGVDKEARSLREGVDKRARSRRYNKRVRSPRLEEKEERIKRG